MTALKAPEGPRLLTGAIGRADIEHQDADMDIAVASEQTDRLRVVTADDCTLADLSALQGYWTQGAVPEADERRQPPDRVHRRLHRVSAHAHPTTSSDSRFLSGPWIPSFAIAAGRHSTPPCACVFATASSASRICCSPRRRRPPLPGATLLARCDLVMEVSVRDNPDRDVVTSAWTTRRRASPSTGSSTRWTRPSRCSSWRTGTYREHGVFGPGAHRSAVLSGFSVDVRESFDAARRVDRTDDAQFPPVGRATPATSSTGITSGPLQAPHTERRRNAPGRRESGSAGRCAPVPARARQLHGNLTFTEDVSR